MDDDELQDFCIALSFEQDDYTVEVIRAVETRMLDKPLFTWAKGHESATSAPAEPLSDATKVLTYKNQPNNGGAWRLGEACRVAADEQKCGDYIDRGLILLRELEARGYGVAILAKQGGAS